MRRLLLSLLLLLSTAGSAYAQRTGDEERAGWYASNPWMLAALVIPLLALILAGAFLLVRRKL